MDACGNSSRLRAPTYSNRYPPLKLSENSVKLNSRRGKTSPNSAISTTMSSDIKAETKGKETSLLGSPNSTDKSLMNQPKTFPCGECGKIFNAHYNLTRHMPVHTGTLCTIYSNKHSVWQKYYLILQD